MLRRLLLTFFTVASLSAFAQDPEFTQFYAAPVYLNPAFAGSARCPRVALNYRNQWPALAKTYITYAASYDQHVEALSGGLGLVVMNDKAGEGTVSTTNVSAIYSYQLNISREFSIKAGLEATFVQKKVDWDKLTFGDMIDPRYGFVYQTQEVRPNETKSFADFSAGVLLFSSKIYGGLAVSHLTQPDEAFIVEGGSQLPMKFTGHLGAMLPVGGTTTYRYKQDRDEGTYISPNVLYVQQGAFNQINVGIYVLHSPIVGGLWYRGSFNAYNSFISSDAFIALIGIQRGIFKFGYSYDITISKLSNATAGSHELSLGLQFGCKPKKKRFRTISCPSF